MARLSVVAILTLVTPLVQGHFAFVRLAHNGEWQAPTQYIRNKTHPFAEKSTPGGWPPSRRYVEPTYIGDYPDSIRCGRGNMDHAADTEVLTVKGGDTIEVAHVRMDPEDWRDEVWYNCPEGRGSCFDSQRSMDINHDGPFLAHLARVPEGMDVREYDGSGEWVKIHSLGVKGLNPNGSPHWAPANEDGTPERFLFKIPKQTPAGQYLVRLDLLYYGIRGANSIGYGFPQIYATCAQIEVSSTGTGTLPEGIKIPEDLVETSPGVSVSSNMYYGKSLDSDYVYPGGYLWTGEEMVEDKPNL